MDDAKPGFLARLFRRGPKPPPPPPLFPPEDARRPYGDFYELGETKFAIEGACILVAPDARASRRRDGDGDVALFELPAAIAVGAEAAPTDTILRKCRITIMRTGAQYDAALFQIRRLRRGASARIDGDVITAFFDATYAAWGLKRVESEPPPEPQPEPAARPHGFAAFTQTLLDAAQLSEDEQRVVRDIERFAAKSAAAADPVRPIRTLRHWVVRDVPDLSTELVSPQPPATTWRLDLIQRGGETLVRVLWNEVDGFTVALHTVPLGYNPMPMRSSGLVAAIAAIRKAFHVEPQEEEDECSATS